MFSTINPTSLLFAFAYALTLIRAAPAVPRAELVVFNPTVLYPNAKTIWFAGQKHNVCHILSYYHFWSIFNSYIVSGYLVCSSPYIGPAHSDLI